MDKMLTPKILLLLLQYAFCYERSEDLTTAIFKRTLWDNARAESYSFIAGITETAHECHVSCVRDSECYGSTFLADGTCYTLHEAGIGPINGTDLLNTIDIRYKALDIVDTTALPLYYSFNTDNEYGITYHPSYSYSGGKAGRALDLTGTNDYAVIDTSVVDKCPFYALVPDCANSQGVTVSMWLKIKDTGKKQQIFHNSIAGATIELDRTLYMQIIVWKTTTKRRMFRTHSYGTAPFEEWFQLTYLLNGAKGKTLDQYWNGFREGETTDFSQGQYNLPAPEDMVLGCVKDDPDFLNAEMEIDELKGWPLLLTTAEVKQLYNSYV